MTVPESGFPRAEAFVPPLPRIDLSYYWNAVWRRRTAIVVTTLICGAAGILVALTSAPKWEATATVAVIQSKLADGQTAFSSPSGFVYFFRNRQSAAETIDQYHLADPPLKLTPDRFVESVLSVSEIRNTNLLSIAVTLGDPKLAADVTNDVVARAKSTARRLTDDEAERARDVFARQLQDQQQRLQTAQQRVLAFRLENKLNVLGDDVATLLGADSGRSDLFTRLATASGRLAEADRQISRLPAEKQERLAQLQLQYDLARTAYASAETQYENARLTVQTRSADLQVVDPAVPPDRPKSPRPLRDTVLSLVAGFVGAVVVLAISAAWTRQ